MKEKNKNETNSWIKWYKATLELTETTILAHKIRKKLVEEGYTVVKILSDYFPMFSKEKIKKDRDKLISGVNSVYALLDDEADETWMEFHLNNALWKMKNKERGKYLISVIRLGTYRDLTVKERARIESLHKNSVTKDEDVEFLMQTVKKVYSGNAGILNNNSVKAMKKYMGRISTRSVENFAEVGRMDSIAYAAAFYILNEHCKNIYDAGQDPYVLGVKTAEYIEKSKMMAWHYQKKIKLAVLKEKMVHLPKDNLIWVTKKEKMNMEETPKREMDLETEIAWEEDMSWKKNAELPDEMKQALKQMRLG